MTMKSTTIMMNMMAMTMQIVIITPMMGIATRISIPLILLKALHSGTVLVNLSHQRTNSMKWNKILIGSPGQRWILISGNGSGSGSLNLIILGHSTMSLASCRLTMITSGNGFRTIQVDITRLTISLKLIKMTQSSGIGPHGTNTGTITMQLS